MKPKEEVTIINRLGLMDAKDSRWNMVHSSKKQITIIIKVMIFLFMDYSPLLSLSLASSISCFVVVMTRTS